MGETLVYRTCDPGETLFLGKTLGGLLMPGDVLALTGDLGSGKTCLTKGVALGLRVPGGETCVTSPSFSLLQVYEGRCPLYHMDAYRLQTLSDFLSAGLEEYFHGDGVVVLEWAERCVEILPEWTLYVAFRLPEEAEGALDEADPGMERTLTLYGNHPRPLRILEALRRGPWLTNNPHFQER